MLLLQPKGNARFEWNCLIRMQKVHPLTELAETTNFKADLLAINAELMKAEDAHASATERFETQLSLTQENLSK